MFDMDTRKDIRMARKIIEHVNNFGGRGYRKYCQIPLKGTENMHDLFNQLDVDFTDSLIVAGSFDQTLEAIRHDAKNIKTFDINKLSEYGIILKFCAILTLEYEEFLKFYGFVPGEVMSKKTYAKIREAMNDEAKNVWDKIFASYSSEAILGNLFDRRKHGPDLDSGPGQISIYTKEGYEEIRRKIWSVFFSFTCCNLLDIRKTSLSEEQYGFIYLSNIRYYIEHLSNEQFVLFLARNILPLLKENGVVVIHYLYGQFPPDLTDTLQYFLFGLFSDIERQDLVQELEVIPEIEVQEHFVKTSGYNHAAGPADVALALRKK